MLLAARESRVVINLNGEWDFEQTEKAFPPEMFSRKIPVPGLVHLARPKIEQYDILFSKPENVEYAMDHDLSKLHYKPRYNWYRRHVKVSEDLQKSEAVLTIRKSKYVTQVFVNGIDVGTSMACYTPVEFPVTHAIRYGQVNEILIRVGDRAWLPDQAAGSTDKEKKNYLPGIWDDVFLSFTGKMRVHRALILPSVREEKITAKILVRNFYTAQTVFGASMMDSCLVKIQIREESEQGNIVASEQVLIATKRDNNTECIINIPLKNAHCWNPDDPFLYYAEITLFEKKKQSDNFKIRFGMRDFCRLGKHFTLNEKKIYLRGSNITLHRFFEDPDCAALPWDREWVKKLLSEIPKSLDWNTMRICVGIAPKMWYDIADETGLLLQNEWLYWQNHGWDEQIRIEYTDWVWSDGNHPSIVIWDAINENWDDYIGNILIPDLKQLDHTRIWDAGFMTSDHMTQDEMDEPHPYLAQGWRQDYEAYFNANPYALGALHDWPPKWQTILESSAAQLVNEYGWMWLWRDGRPAKLMEKVIPFYLGESHSTYERRLLQAYWEQLQTEWLRTERSIAGVLAFCYLTNNYGFTGDWFVDDIQDLKPGSTLSWFKHCFAPVAVFIDLVDQRYTKFQPPYQPGTKLDFNLVGINDYDYPVTGNILIKLFDADGNQVVRRQTKISIPAFFKKYKPINIQLPQTSGGYLLLSEFTPQVKQKTGMVISRRYIKVGKKDSYVFFDYLPESE